MKNRLILKTLIGTASILCTYASFAEKNLFLNRDVQQSMQELNQTSSSIQKINIIFKNCQMKQACILKALSELAKTQNDSVAKYMLEELSKQAAFNFDLYNKCFEKQKAKVDLALSVCISQSRQPPLLSDKSGCFEKALLSLVESGNTVAQQVLTSLYETQKDNKKLNDLYEKIGKLGPDLFLKQNKECDEGLNKTNK